MDKTITLNQIISFLKRKIKLIIITTILVLLSSLAFSYYRENVNEQSEVDLVLDETELQELLVKNPAELTNREAFLVENYSRQDRYYFSVYIENRDYTYMTNSRLIQDILLTEEAKNLLSEIIDLPEDEHLEAYLNVNFNSSNSLFVIDFRSGDRELNNRLANAYYEIMSNDQIEFFENRNLYFFSEPEHIENQDEEIFIEEESEYVPNYIIISLSSILFGALLGTLLAVLHSIYGKKIDLFYNFKVDNDDKLVNLSKFSKDGSFNKDLQDLLNGPSTNTKLILAEDELADTLPILNNSDSVIHSNDLPNEVSKVDTAVILIKLGETDKKWYEMQKLKVKNSNLALEIIGI